MIYQKIFPSFTAIKSGGLSRNCEGMGRLRTKGRPGLRDNLRSPGVLQRDRRLGTWDES